MIQNWVVAVASLTNIHDNKVKNSILMKDR